MARQLDKADQLQLALMESDRLLAELNLVHHEFLVAARDGRSEDLDAMRLKAVVFLEDHLSAFQRACDLSRDIIGG